MVFQNITFKHTNSSTQSTLHDYVTQKMSGLEKYVGDESNVRCEVEFEKVISHKSGKVCRIEVNVWVGATLFRAEATEATFEAAVDVVRDDLGQEMRDAHKKRNSLIRRGGRKIKEMMRFGG